MLDVLRGRGGEHLAAQAGQSEQAVELSICVSCHPASTQEAKERAEQLIAELEAQLTPEQIETFQSQETGVKTFDATVTKLLNAS